MTRRVLGMTLAASLAATLGTAPAHAADLASGKKVYADKCVRCHGPGGKGDGPKAETLEKKPTNYTDKGAMAKITDQDMKKVILEGKQPMPSYKGKISDKELDGVVAYIRTFAK